MPLKLVKEELTLVYGLRLFTGRGAQGGPHTHVMVASPSGREHEMAIHTISGSRQEIRERLLQSIDAFFEICDPVDEG